MSFADTVRCMWPTRKRIRHGIGRSWWSRTVILMERGSLHPGSLWRPRMTGDIMETYSRVVREGGGGRGRLVFLWIHQDVQRQYFLSGPFRRLSKNIGLWGAVNILCTLYIVNKYSVYGYIIFQGVWIVASTSITHRCHGAWRGQNSVPLTTSRSENPT